MRTSRPLAALAGAALALGPALPAAASHDVTPDRIGGQTRYGTAAEIALDSHPDGASEVIIASGERYPDALAGSPIAAALDAPVLLVEQDHVPDATISALDELAPDHATILGGEVAVSAQVEQTIEEDGQTPADRIAGDTRYETAAKIAREVQQRNGNPANWPGDQRAAFLTTGEGFPDALSAGALAASREEAPIPVLLTRRDEVPAATEAAIEDLDIELVIVIGGPDAISEDVQAAIDDDDTTTDRVAGATRTATATAVADYAIQYLGFDEDDLTLTRGDAFPDALSVAPMTGANHNPILLTANATELSEPTRAWLAEACGAVDRIRGIGQTKPSASRSWTPPRPPPRTATARRDPARTTSSSRRRSSPPPRARAASSRSPAPTTVRTSPARRTWPSSPTSRCSSRATVSSASRTSTATATPTASAPRTPVPPPSPR